jgi:hypothetical protein
MAASLYLSPLTFIVQYFTNLGVIAAGASVQTNLAGSVSTLQTTYTDSTGLVPNANPLTLNSAARPAGSSGALVAFWQPAGVAIDAIFTDTVGETWTIRNIPGINDPSSSGSLQTLLASPASSNVSGSGPVAGVDLVANALKSYDVFADVRAANAPVLAVGQTLTISVQGAASINDGLGGDFYWNATSTATDNNASVIKPNAATGAGRFIRLGTPPFGAAASIASAGTVDLGTVGSNIVSISGSIQITSFGSSASLARPLYFLTFSAAAQLGYNATSMILPGAATITCANGDAAIALYLGSGNWQVLAYFRSQASPVGPLYIDKPTTQSVVSSTVLVNDTALACQLVSGTYLVQLRLMLIGVTTTTQGYKVQLNFGGSLGAAAQGAGVLSGNGSPTTVFSSMNTPIISAAIADAASPDVVNMDFMIPVSATGTLNVQFAQNSSSANSTSMLGGSQMIVTKVA